MARDLKARATAPARTGDAATAAGKELSLPQKIERMQKEFAMAQPRGMEAVQLIRDAQTCVRMTPKLAECEHTSVLGALMTCAQLGLRPGVLGQAYLLPLWNGRNRRMEAQLVLGYQGLLELIYRSGVVSMVDARVRYENDEWLFEYGIESDKLIHRPAEGHRGKAVAYYAIARFKDGAVKMTRPVTVAEMEEHRDKYAMAKKKDGTVVGPWVTQFDEMAKKTVLRDLAKTMPKSPEVSRAITHDGAVRADATPAAVDAQPDYIDGEYSEAPGTDDDAHVDNPVDSPPADDEQGEPDPTPQQRVADYLQGAGITDPDNIAGWLQQAIGDPDAPANPADLTADEAARALDVIAESN